MSNKEEKREWYHFLKEHHICVCCGQRDAFHNKTMCPECLEKHNKRTSERYAKDKEQIQQRALCRAKSRGDMHPMRPKESDKRRLLLRMLC